MFGSAVLEVVIGLILVFLLVSLICTAAREAFENFLKDRSGVLERGIRLLLSDPDGTKLTKRFFDHGLIAPLSSGKYTLDDLKPRGGVPFAKPPEVTTCQQLETKVRKRNGMPSYIPARNFALALLDLSAEGKGGGDPSSRLSAIRDTLDGKGELKLPDDLREVLRSALDAAENDLERAREEIEAWYNGTMDRISGWYKRRSQYFVFFIAFAIAAGLNIDAFTIADRLSTNDSVRAALVAQADALVIDKDGLNPLEKQTQKELEERLGKLSLPTGWGAIPQATAACLPNSWGCIDLGHSGILPWDWECVPGDQLAATELDAPRNFLPWRSIIVMLVGWLITALAAMLGAPFWFDTLNKIMVIRSTVKPHEKSQEEGTEDRRDTKKPVTPPASSPPTAQPGALPGHTSHAWSSGNAQEGLI